MTDSQVLTDAVNRYGVLPGGIVVEGEAQCEVPIRSVAIDPGHPSRLVINDSLKFETYLSAEELALLCHAVFETHEAETNFGVLSQCRTIGIDSDTVVAHCMMNADNWLGGIVYGFDSQFVLGKSHVSDYRNPFVEQANQITNPEEYTRFFFNLQYGLHPQFFLKINGATFARTGPDSLALQSTEIMSATGVVDDHGKLIDKLPTFPHANPLVKDRFPWVYRAYEHFQEHFHEYCDAEPTLARTIAYSEVILFLRLARSANAAFVGTDRVFNLVANRQRVSIPRFDYTLRSPDFAALAARTSRDIIHRIYPEPSNALPLLPGGLVTADQNSIFKTQLSWSTDAQIDEWVHHIIAAIVALDYAVRSGDAELFQQCQQFAVRYIEKLYQLKLSLDAPLVHRELNQMLPAILAHLSSAAHDHLIGNCFNVALNSNCAEEDKATYLMDALKHCGTEDTFKKCPATRCRWVQIKCHLDTRFDPIPGLAARERTILQTWSHSSR